MKFENYDSKLILEALRQAIANVNLEEDTFFDLNLNFESDEKVLKIGVKNELGRLFDRRK